jgi:hypothetical protein
VPQRGQPCGTLVLVVRYVFRKVASSRGLPHHNKKLWTPGERRPPSLPRRSSRGFLRNKRHPSLNTTRGNRPQIVQTMRAPNAGTGRYWPVLTLSGRI